MRSLSRFTLLLAALLSCIAFSAAQAHPFAALHRLSARQLAPFGQSEVRFRRVRRVKPEQQQHDQRRGELSGTVRLSAAGVDEVRAVAQVRRQVDESEVEGAGADGDGEGEGASSQAEASIPSPETVFAGENSTSSASEASRFIAAETTRSSDQQRTSSSTSIDGTPSLSSPSGPTSIPTTLLAPSTTQEDTSTTSLQNSASPSSSGDEQKSPSSGQGTEVFTSLIDITSSSPTSLPDPSSAASSTLNISPAPSISPSAVASTSTTRLSSIGSSGTPPIVEDGASGQGRL